MNKNIIIALVVIIILIIGGYFLTRGSSQDVSTIETQEETDDVPEPSEVEEEVQEQESVIGSSIEYNDIYVHHYGDFKGDTELLFVGGIHGGYSWNTVLVAYETIDWLEANPEVIPEGIQVSVIPVLNPDGLEKIVGSTDRFSASDAPSSVEATIPGRFNANEVDLNRNFDCDWQPSGTWQSTTVSGGDSAFSEPESQAFRDYIEANNPDAVVVWYSSAGGVFASNCHDGILPETDTITNLYADASGYPAYEDFNFYEITGDMVNWLASENIPAISVLLTTHEDVEWSKNKAGIEALLAYYAE